MKNPGFSVILNENPTFIIGKIILLLIQMYFNGGENPLITYSCGIYIPKRYSN